MVATRSRQARTLNALQELGIPITVTQTGTQRARRAVEADRQITRDRNHARRMRRVTAQQMVADANAQYTDPAQMPFPVEEANRRRRERESDSEDEPPLSNFRLNEEPDEEVLNMPMPQFQFDDEGLRPFSPHPARYPDEVDLAIQMINHEDMMARHKPKLWENYEEPSDEEDEPPMKRTMALPYAPLQLQPTNVANMNLVAANVILDPLDTADVFDMAVAQAEAQADEEDTFAMIDQFLAAADQVQPEDEPMDQAIADAIEHEEFEAELPARRYRRWKPQYYGPRRKQYRQVADTRPTYLMFIPLPMTHTRQ